ncbi:MAG: helix-turn-helix domain-containing protein [Thaumarchaeota archaeon]|nr:helix-turn-helix domain-containing protein [Nitrososphaerota archaeon]
MKRLVLEGSYEKFWLLFFGRNAKRVQVVDALKCFKCDPGGFAIICKIKFLDKEMTVTDLTKGGLIKDVETLYKEKDGSLVVFISGDFPEDRVARTIQFPRRVFLEGPPEFIDANRIRCAIVGEEKELRKVMSQFEELEKGMRILSLTRLKPKSEGLASTLTAKQRQALLTAYGLGYYDVPRKVPSEHLAELLNIDKSTLAEHLRKAEARVIKSVLT